MAVPVIASSTESSGSGTSTTVNMPATRPDDDIFIAIGSKDDDNAWSSVPGAWGAAVLDIGQGTGEHRLTLWAWKGATEPASYGISHDNEITEFTILRLTGGDENDIIEASGSNTGDSAQATAPDITPTNSNTLALRVFGCDRRTFSNLPATVEVNVGAGGAGDVSLAVSFADGPAGGSGTGTATGDLSATDEWIAFTVCVNEVVAPPSGTGAQGLPSLNQAGSGVQTFTATAAQGLPSPVQDGVALMVPSATGAQGLPSPLQAGAGVETFTATAAQGLPSPVQAGVALMVPSATAAQGLPSMVQAGGGVEIFTAAAVQTLGALAQSGVGIEVFTATGAQILGALLQSAAGTVGEVITATGANLLPAIIQAGIAIIIFVPGSAVLGDAGASDALADTGGTVDLSDTP